MKRKLFSVIALAVMPVLGGETSSAEQQVRELIQRWDAAYCSLDAAGLAALAAPDFELINRLGQWTPMSSRAELERMWSWGFTNIYRGVPGPRHTIERMRFLSANTAIVQTHASWPALKLDNGMDIPPHGEITTFVAVKQPGGWRVASESIHNQMPGDELPATLPWNVSARDTK